MLIIDRETNEITLEKLHNNIQVKKTRADSNKPSSSNNNNNKPVNNILTQKVEGQNQTTRLSSKTRVSTGVRKNVVSFVPKISPIQGSPLWNANNTQQTLPSIPMIGLDDISETLQVPAQAQIQQQQIQMQQMQMFEQHPPPPIPQQQVTQTQQVQQQQIQHPPIPQISAPPPQQTRPMGAPTHDVSKILKIF